MDDRTAAELFRLGKSYYGIRNRGAAKNYLMQAVMKGSSSAARLLFTLGKEFLGEKTEEGYGHAEDCFQALADRGHAESCLYLGILCRDGLGRERDARRAFGYFDESYRLGLGMGAYEAGQLIMKDAFNDAKAREVAIEWFKAAADDGVTEAYTKIGLLLCDNLPQHYAEALKWFLKGIREKDTDAMVYASDLYITGFGVNKNPRIALALLHRAAAEGNRKANSILGGLYAAGKYVEQDDRKAAAFYQKAAECGTEE